MKKLDKTKILIIIGISTLLITVIGATYAFFSINASNTGIGNTTTIGGAETRGLITMTTNVSELYLKLSGADMTEEKAGTFYYATTTPTTANMKSNYLLESDPHEFDLATFTLDSGTTKYNCDYKYKVTAEVTGLTEEQKTKMIEDRSAEDIVVVFDNNKTINLSELLEAGTIGVEVNGTIKNLTAGKDQTIKVYSTFENTLDNQDSLSGINYTIKIEPDKENSFKCSVSIPEKGITAEYMAANYEEYGLWSSGLEDDGYRFISNDNNNYVCFGSNDKNEYGRCIGDMYEIIGLFQEENGDGTIKQNSPYHFKLHLDGVKMNYSSEWENKIAEWNWTIVNTQSNSNGPYYVNTNAEAIYMHEMNRKSKKNYQCTTKSNVESSETCTIGSWSYNNAKYGFLYVSDIMLSIGEDAINNKLTGANLDNYGSWLANRNSEIYTLAKADDNEYYYKTNYSVTVGTFGELSSWSWNPYDDTNHYETTIYLNDDVTIINGVGTNDDPYMIGL